MIHLEAWYQEAGLEESLRSLEERARHNDLHALVSFLRLRQRLGRDDRFSLLNIYNDAHPGGSYGTLYTISRHVESRLEALWQEEEVVPPLEKIEDLLRGALHSLNALERYSEILRKGRHRVSENFLRRLWQRAESSSEEALQLYDSLLSTHFDEVAP